MEMFYCRKKITQTAATKIICEMQCDMRQLRMELIEVKRKRMGLIWNMNWKFSESFLWLRIHLSELRSEITSIAKFML